MKAYVISVGDKGQYGESLYEHFTHQMQELVSERYWKGHYMALQLGFDGQKLTVSGGCQRLPITELRLMPYRITASTYESLQYSWQTRINMHVEIDSCKAVIMICDAKAFFDDYNVRIQVARIRTMMMRIESDVPLRLFLIGMENVMDAVDDLPLSEAQWRMITALGCCATRKLHLKDEYHSIWPEISSTYMLQWHARYYSRYGKPVGVPLGIIANYRDGTSSGYSEMLLFLLNRIGECRGLRMAYPMRNRLQQFIELSTI